MENVLSYLSKNHPELEVYKLSWQNSGWVILAHRNHKTHTWVTATISGVRIFSWAGGNYLKDYNSAVKDFDRLEKIDGLD